MAGGRRYAPAAVLFGLGLVLRLWFAAHESGEHLYWDEVHYNASAKAYARAWAALVGDGPAGAAWREAFSISRQKGEAYALIAGLVYAVSGNNPTAVFILQAVLDAFTCLFLYVVARRLAGKRAGLIALAMGALYEPFIFTAARLQTETLAAFLLMGACAAVCSFTSRPKAAHFGAGLSLAIALLTKPALKFLWILWLPFLAGEHDTGRWRPRFAAVAFVLGVFAIVGPRLSLTYVLTGEATWTGDLDPGVHVYTGAIPEDGGWRTMGYRPSGELLEVLGGADRYATSEDYWRAAIRTWVYHPVSSAGVALHKLYRAWRHPYNDSQRRLLGGDTPLRIYHGTLLLLGLLGLPLALRRGRIGWLLVMTAIYLWGAYLAIAIEVRYAVTVMPLMLCFAAIACTDMAAGWERLAHPQRRRLLAVAVALLASAAALSELDVGHLLALLPVSSVATAHLVRIAAAVAISIGVAGVAAALLRPAMSQRAVVAAVGVALLLADLTLVVGDSQAPEWRQWSAPLATGGAIARHDVGIPSAASPPVHLNLLFDARRTCAQSFSFVVRINGREVHRSRDGLGEPTSVLLKQEDARKILRAQRHAAESFPGWHMLTLPADLIDGQTLRVELLVEDGPSGTDCVELFGDYQDEAGLYIGPSVLSPWRLEHGSVYRYLVAGDYRMWRQTPVDASSQSRLGELEVADDLSPAPGRQTGRYRLFLVLTYARQRLIF